MQNFFNLGGKEERTKLIQCIAEKIARLTKQIDTVNNQRNYFTLYQLAWTITSQNHWHSLGCCGWRDGPILCHRLGFLARPHAQSCTSLITALKAAWYHFWIKATLLLTYWATLAYLRVLSHLSDDPSQGQEPLAKFYLWPCNPAWLFFSLSEQNYFVS